MDEQTLQIRQEELEQVGSIEGQMAFLNRHRKLMQSGNATGSSPVHKLVLEGIKRLDAALTHWHEAKLAYATTKGGMPHSALRWIALMADGTSDKQVAHSRELIAYLTMISLLDGIARKRSYRAVCREIALRIQDECKYRRFKKEAPELYRYRMDKLKHSTSKRHAKSALAQTMGYAEMNWPDLEMGPAEQLHLGNLLIDLSIDSSSMFAIHTFKRGSTNGKARSIRTDKFISVTPEIMSWLTSRVNSMMWMFPNLYPMVQTPLPWSKGQRGGYRYRLKGKYLLTRRASKETSEDIANSATPALYSALNALQNVAWKINEDVLKVAEALRDDFQGDVAGLPSFRPFSKPPRPPNFETLDLEEQRLWKRNTSEKIAADRIRQSEITKALEIMRVAREMSGYDEIFMPWSLDFRGRVYPLSSFLHPQGDDLARSLLTFARGVKLGPDGAFWLAVHGANTLDEIAGRKTSSMTNDERVAQIKIMEPQLRQLAKDPLTDLWWVDLDAPLAMLAFAAEWTRYLDSGEGEDFVSYLPIMLDGTANGLQHFSAMFRDEEAGKLVNLTNLRKPEDLYAKVAEVLKAKVQEDAEGGDELAIMWNRSGLISRKLVKRPVMSFLYGSRAYGFRTQTSDLIKKDAKLALQAEVFGSRTVLTHKGKERQIDNIAAACSYFANTLIALMRVEVSAASEGMDWLQDRARLIAQSNKAVHWVVPFTGLVVRQEYVKESRRQISTTLQGKLSRPSWWVKTANVDRRRQVNGISPNVVHSLDACHLMLMVNEANENGVTDISVIHDSFGTHAGNTNILRKATRETFVRLYSMNVARFLEGQFLSQIEDPSDLSAMPTEGTLDIHGVLSSEYFFA